MTSPVILAACPAWGPRRSPAPPPPVRVSREPAHPHPAPARLVPTPPPPRRLIPDWAPPTAPVVATAGPHTARAYAAVRGRGRSMSAAAGVARHRTLAGAPRGTSARLRARCPRRPRAIFPPRPRPQATARGSPWTARPRSGIVFTDQFLRLP
ncbi:hypothetical protein C8J57DRAFT_238135 [Mycena rebaudengoi]|nr:hypothetical protein C8J57DRAFT_238135 [Mycena rebaudengoi]